MKKATVGAYLMLVGVVVAAPPNSELPADLQLGVEDQALEVTLKAFQAIRVSAAVNYRTTLQKARQDTLLDLEQVRKRLVTADRLDEAVKVRNFMEQQEKYLQEEPTPEIQESPSRVMKTALKKAVQFKGHRYLLLPKKMLWWTANEQAREMGGYLVRVDTEGEDEFLVRTFGPQARGEADYLWVDGIRLEDEQWYLTNKKNLGPIRWEASQPNGGSERHLLFSQRGYHDCQAETLHQALIEIPETSKATQK